MKNILHGELSYIITGLCFKIHNDMGRFCRERQYADELEKLLKQNNIQYEREFEIQKLHLNSPFGNRVDFLIEGKIIVELKAKQFILKEDYFQAQRYLQCSGLELCLLINFRTRYISPRRVLNYELYKQNQSSFG